MSKKFDLNIEKVLENWEIHHAIRELIANAIDEQILTNTKDIEISRTNNDSDCVIRDFGRGIKETHFTQNENKEKIESEEIIIGKFGVGLKDALATFDRNKIDVQIKSKYGDFYIEKSSKTGFDNIKTLHVMIDSSSSPEMVGTEVVLKGCKFEDLESAKNLFLRFSQEEVLEKTKFGDVLEKKTIGKIFVNGMEVAREENFLFSYNITSLTNVMKKALNRERVNVGRKAYAERIKAILLKCTSERVIEDLIRDLKNFKDGDQKDEMKWLDVSYYACQILGSKDKKIIFVSPDEMQGNQLQKATADGYRIVVVHEQLNQKLKNSNDFKGNPMKSLEQYNKEYNDSFKYKFVNYEDLNSKEQKIFDKKDLIFDFVDIEAKKWVKKVCISETMRINEFSGETLGVWEREKQRIIIKRNQLSSMEKYAGTLIHEMAHAVSGKGDCTVEFEDFLTEIIGKITNKIIKD